MRRFIAPEITTVTLGDFQQRVAEACAAAIEVMGKTLWERGRGAGKSTTRAKIAQMILDHEEYPMYEVRPIVRRDDA